MDEWVVWAKNMFKSPSLSTYDSHDGSSLFVPRYCDVVGWPGPGSPGSYGGTALANLLVDK